MQTANLRIRKFNDDDFNDFMELIRDKMDSEYAIYDQTYPTDNSSLKKILDYFSSTDEFYAVELIASKKVIGFLTMNLCEEQDVRNLGYCIHTQYQGKGYGTEAINEIIRFAKDEMKIRKLITGTAKKNIPSVRLLAALGFNKTAESNGSFAKDNNGNPIEFLACSYELPLI